MNGSAHVRARARNSKQASNSSSRKRAGAGTDPPRQPHVTTNPTTATAAKTAQSGPGHERASVPVPLFHLPCRGLCDPR
jgi:hypothetical protein